MLLLLLNPGAWIIASSASSSFPALFLSMDFFSLGLENLVTLKTEENVSSVTFFPHALVKVCLQYSMWVYYSVSLRNMYKSLNGLNLLLNLASSFTFYRNSILCSILVFLSLFFYGLRDLFFQYITLDFVLWGNRLWEIWSQWVLNLPDASIIQMNLIQFYIHDENST